MLVFTAFTLGKQVTIVLLLQHMHCILNRQRRGRVFCMVGEVDSKGRDVELCVCIIIYV